MGVQAIIALTTDLVKVRLSLLYISYTKLLFDFGDPMSNRVARRKNISLTSFPPIPILHLGSLALCLRASADVESDVVHA